MRCPFRHLNIVYITKRRLIQITKQPGVSRENDVAYRFIHCLLTDFKMFACTVPLRAAEGNIYAANIYIYIGGGERERENSSCV